MRRARSETSVSDRRTVRGLNAASARSKIGIQVVALTLALVRILGRIWFRDRLEVAVVHAFYAPCLYMSPLFLH